MALITVERGDLEKVREVVLKMPHKRTYWNNLGNLVVVFDNVFATLSINAPDEAIDIALDEVEHSNSFAEVLFEALADQTRYEVHVYDDDSGEEIFAIHERRAAD